MCECCSCHINSDCSLQGVPACDGIGRVSQLDCTCMLKELLLQEMQMLPILCALGHLVWQGH